MENVNVIYERLENGKYIKEWETSDVSQVYRDLAEELISKKINACNWIKSIR